MTEESIYNNTFAEAYLAAAAYEEDWIPGGKLFWNSINPLQPWNNPDIRVGISQEQLNP